jgi:methyl-accepting chemotaxis protein
MQSTWTFGRRIALGFTLSFVLLVAVGGVAYRSIRTLADASQLVTHSHAVLEEIQRVLSSLQDVETSARGYVIVGDDAFLEPYASAQAALPGVVAELRELTADNAAQQRRIDEMHPLVEAKLANTATTIELRRSGDVEGAMARVRTGTGQELMSQVRRITGEMAAEENRLLDARAAEAATAVSQGTSTIFYGTVISLALVVGLGFAITRSLTTQVGSAVLHVQSSSSELQTAANQQASGAREQATAMNEITTTINELMATSRQIAESAQRVAQIADETAKFARAGEGTVARSGESMTTIRKQVDLIVTHMLELGKKSQQIGGILEIINELSEQTNILAINATIEAAGAGEQGKRFGVVADEIRKLADRVGGSTKEIRTLIDEIRAAVNTTVMATEGGSKAVDAGTRQFAETSSSLRQIVGSVGTTTEAAREIELSTKQQATAVEQVNVAIASVAQATRETEASASQILQTASQLNGLSRDLLRIVQPGATA